MEKELVDLRWSPWYRIPDTSFQRQLARCWEHQGRIPWWQERNWSQSGSGADLNGRKPKTSVEKNSNKQGKMDEATKGTDLNGREPLAAGGK